MDPNRLVRLAVDNDPAFMRAVAVLRCLPDDYAPKTLASRGFNLEVKIDSGKVVAHAFAGYETVFRADHKTRKATLLWKDGVLAEVDYGPGGFHCNLFSDGDDATAIMEEVARAVRPHLRRNTAQDGVLVEFSRLGDGGVVRTTDFLRCPKWRRIADNYPAATRPQLDSLFRTRRPWERGRLMIWHGAPGTGKTFAARALMMHWRDRFDFLVVTDPENLARDPGYYFDVASDRRYATATKARGCSPRHPGGDFDEEEDDAAEEQKRVLFIMEDAADLILEESRARHYDKVAKLLAMTDGLFGQGREDIFLVTCNEPALKIDPAFLRPGRCIAEVRFEKFGAEEASGWLANRNACTPASRGAMTLAEMYGALQTAKDGGLRPPGPETPAVGFQAGKRGK